MLGVEEGGVGVGDLGGEAEHIDGHPLNAIRGGLAGAQQVDRRLRPDSPVTEQTALEPSLDPF